MNLKTVEDSKHLINYECISFPIRLFPNEEQQKKIIKKIDNEKDPQLDLDFAYFEDNYLVIPVDYSIKNQYFNKYLQKELEKIKFKCNKILESFLADAVLTKFTFYEADDQYFCMCDLKLSNPVSIMHLQEFLRQGFLLTYNPQSGLIVTPMEFEPSQAKLN